MGPPWRGSSFGVSGNNLVLEPLAFFLISWNPTWIWVPNLGKWTPELLVVGTAGFWGWGARVSPSCGVWLKIKQLGQMTGFLGLWFHLPFGAILGIPISF